MPIDSVLQMITPSLTKANTMSKSATVQKADGQIVAAEKQTFSVQPGNQEVISVDLDKVVEQLNSFIQGLRRDVHFAVDEDTGRTIVRVIESDSGELIRQIPSEEVLAVSRLMKDSLNADGLLLTAHV